MLHTGGVQLFERYQGPSFSVTLHIKEILHTCRRLKVIDIAMLQKRVVLDAYLGSFIFGFHVELSSIGVGFSLWEKAFGSVTARRDAE